MRTLKQSFLLLIVLCIPGFAGISIAGQNTPDRALQKRLNVEREWREAALHPRLPDVAPPNDLCSGAEAIPAAGPFPYLTAVTADITDATTTGDPALPSCQTDVSRSIWYKFTPAATATYDLSLCSDVTGTTVDDTVLTVYSSSDGTCTGSFVEEACNDDDDCIAEGLQSSVSAGLTAGTTYFILVHKFSSAPPTAGNKSIQLRVDLPPAVPANDNCSGTVPALALNTPVAGVINAVTTDDFQLSGAGCFSGIGQTASTAPGRDVVYSFTPPSTGNYSFKVNSSGTSNPVLYVASTCAAGTVGTCVGASNRNVDTSPASEEVMCLALTGGTPYTVYVDEAAATAGTSFTLEVDSCILETESNDTTPTANALACGIEGSITPAGEVDFYDLGTPASGSRVFAMAEGLGSSGNHNFDMRVTTGTDTLQYDDSNNAPAFGDLAPNCAGTQLTGVQSFIEMSHNDAGVVSEPYRLYSVVQGDSSTATAESEPNDTIGTANAAANNYFSGSMSSTTDKDVFKVLAAAGDLLIVQLDTDPGRNNTPFNGALELLDAAGSVLVSVNDFNATSSTTSGAGNLFATTPFSPGEALTWRVRTPGNYYVRVTYAPLGATTPGDYLLSISKNCAAGGGGGAALADLSVTKSDAPDPVVPNHNITYTITVANGGPNAAEDATLTDVIPANTTYQSLSAAAGWSCTTPSVGGTGTVSCSNATYGVSPSDLFTLTVKVNGSLSDGTIITNTVDVSASTQDPNTSNNTASTTTSTQCPAITVSPFALPAGQTGALYGQTISASGGTAAYTFGVTSGSLPSGLTLDSGGSLSGTPTVSGAFNFTVTATDADGCTGSHAYSLFICAVISVLPASLPDGSIGQAYSQTLTGNGGTGPYSFVVASGALPTGLSLSSGGAITGTPTASGTFNFDVQATDSNGCAGTQSYSIFICPAITITPASLPGGSIGQAYSQTLTGNGGTGPYSFVLASGALPSGLSLSSAGAITGTPTASGTFNFDVQATDNNGCTGTQTYSLLICPVITITPSSLPGGGVGQVYSQTLTGNGGTGPYTFTVASGSLPNGLSLSAGGTISGTPTTIGTFNFTVQAADNNGCTGTQAYTIAICAPITVSPPTLPDGLVGQPYNQTVSASGGVSPYAYSATGTLPPGITLNSGTGDLTGTPTTFGSFNFTITATDANLCAGSQAYTVGTCPAISSTPATLPDGDAGQVYSQTLSGAGGTGPYTFSVVSGSLPAGLTLSASGTISGTPTGSGPSNFDVQITDSNGCTGTQSYSITIGSCLFCDDFNDATLAGNWTYVKQTWTEPAGGNLIGTPSGKKAVAVATPAFAGCSTCTVEATMSTAGGVGNSLWMLGWYVDKKNAVELLMKQESSKWLLKERIAGVVVAKAKGIAPINVNQSYDVVVAFDGTTFTVTIDGGAPIITLSAHGPHTGTVGFQVKSTTGTFGMINVN